MSLRPFEHASPKDWTDHDNARLTLFWNDGMYVSELARRFHCTKQVIYRQVRALGLMPRPSPIRPPRATPKPPKHLPRGASTLPPLASLQETC